MKKASKEETKPVKEKIDGVKAKPKASIRETDLYEPIYNYLTAQGYSVHSEVKNCDVAAMKGDELVVVEMKTAFNLKLLSQAAKRQRAADSVYVAIPRPKGGKMGSAWRDMCFLLRRLELGLILVDLREDEPMVDIAFHPNTFDRLKSSQSGKKVRRSIIKESEARYGDFNKGGSNKCRLMTSYKENCMHIACCLEKHGTLSPAQLKKLGTGKKTQSILTKNFYGWYEKVDKGRYAINQEGREFMQKYPELANHYYQKLEAMQNETGEAAEVK